MISEVHIKNFQSLKDVRLKFGPLTVIYGPSDVGKSAVIRAIKAVYTNRYPPDHVTHGEEFSTISITVDNKVVVAQKGSGVNRYLVKLPGSEPKVFNKVGKQVPSEVTDILGFSDHSIGSQFDPLFLLSESGHARAKMLGELSNFAVLLEAVRLGKVYTRRAAQTENVLLEKAAATTRSIEECVAEHGALVQRRDALAEVVKRFNAAAGRLGQLKTLEEECGRRGYEVQAAGSAVDRLSVRLPDLSGVPPLLERLAEVSALERGLSNAEFEAAKRAHGSAVEGLAESEKAFSEFQSQNPFCPTCGKEGWHG